MTALTKPAAPWPVPEPMAALISAVAEAVPEATLSQQAPRLVNGCWWLDARLGESFVVVEYNPKHGFGVSKSAGKDLYNEGPDEVFVDPLAAAARVVDLVKFSDRYTAPRAEVVLREIRADIGLTQQELAERLGVQQAAVSRMERRDVMSLRSLNRYVEALGGTLEVNVRMPDGRTVAVVVPGGQP